MTEPGECPGCCKNRPGQHCPLPPEQCACELPTPSCNCCQCSYCTRAVATFSNVHLVCIAHHDACPCGRHDHLNGCPCISCMLATLRAVYALPQREDDPGDAGH